jgi:hypothetical protein
MPLDIMRECDVKICGQSQKYAVSRILCKEEDTYHAKNAQKSK